MMALSLFPVLFAARCSNLISSTLISIIRLPSHPESMTVDEFQLADSPDSFSTAFSRLPGLLKRRINSPPRTEQKPWK